MPLFVGVDPGQTNQGVCVIDEKLNVVGMIDTGVGIPKELKGKGLPDIVRNSYVYYQTKALIDQFDPSEIKMCLMEGPNYSSKFNVTPISIGSIHGQNQIYFWTQHIDFAVVPPRSIQVGIHGTSADITKAMTKQRMYEIFGDQLPKKGFTYNESDALGMAYLARQLYLLLIGKVNLTVGEQKLFLAHTKIKGKRRGLVYHIGTRLFIFDSKGNANKPIDGETLTEFYFRTKENHHG